MIATENLKKAGIYCAIHRDSLRCYVGSSVNIHNRRHGHIRAETESAFHRAVRQHGASAFDFEVLELCEKDQLLKREEFWITFLHSASVTGFNTIPRPTSVPYGKEISIATRQRISAAHKGRKHTPEALSRMQAGRNTPESKAKRTASHTGHPVSVETRAKLRAANLGKPMPLATKAAIRKANLGRVTPEHIKAKLRLAHTGKIMSEAARAKMSISQKARFERERLARA